MNRYRTHRRLVAWLGLLAMWLAVVAPVISQTLPVTSQATASEAWCGDVAPHDGHAPAAPHDHSLEKCGYCALLGDSPILGASLWLPHFLPPARAELDRPLQTAPRIRHRALAAAPRGPPGAARS